MPTYEYRCRDCGEDLEVVQAFTDDALTVCPACGGSLRKVFGNVGISFKGAGFYKNDARGTSKASSDSSKDSSSDTSSTTSTSTSSSDSSSSSSSDSSKTKPKTETAKSA